MRLAGARSPKGALARREQMLSARTRSAAMKLAFPQLERLRIELTFGGTDGLPPSPQVHTLYPAANAFFRFACPCADCDGDFDLTEVVAALAKSGAVTSRGRLVCDGMRRDHPAAHKACSIRLDYLLTSS